MSAVLGYPQLPIAHAGHWTAGILYLTPVALLGCGIAYQRFRDRQAARELSLSPDESTD